MPKFADFDLNLKQTTSDQRPQPRITSVVACTPGTCWNTCKGQSTLNSNCCFGSSLCSLGGC